MGMSRVFWASVAVMVILFYLPAIIRQGFYGFPLPVYQSVPHTGFFPYALLIDLFFIIAVPLIINFIYVSNKMNKEEKKRKR